MESFTFGFASPISAAESGEICAAESGEISAAESGEISAAESGEISPLFEESPKTTGDARDGAHHCAQDGAQDGAGTWSVFEADGAQNGAQNGAQDGAGTWAAFEADGPNPSYENDARDGAHHCAQDGAQDGPNPSYEDDRPAAAATERCPERATERSVYLLFAFNHVGAAPLPAHLMASDDTAHCP